MKIARFQPSFRDRRVFGELAGEYDLVYFGRVDPRESEDYEPIRGVTLNANSGADENFTAGDVYDYGVKLAQRSRKVVLANGEKQVRNWTILQVQLKNFGEKSYAKLREGNQDWNKNGEGSRRNLVGDEKDWRTVFMREASENFANDGGEKDRNFAEKESAGRAKLTENGENGLVDQKDFAKKTEGNFYQTAKWLPHFLVDGRTRAEEYGKLEVENYRWRDLTQGNFAKILRGGGEEVGGKSEISGNLETVGGDFTKNVLGKEIGFAKKLDEDFYALKLEESFANIFAIFAQAEDAQEIASLISREVQLMLAAHFAQFDYEILGDKLLVYATNQRISRTVLDLMLRIGLWWARKIDGLA